MEELNKKIADLEVQVQNQQKMIEKLINYLGVDFSKSPKQVLSQALKKTCRIECQRRLPQLKL